MFLDVFAILGIIPLKAHLIGLTEKASHVYLSIVNTFMYVLLCKRTSEAIILSSSDGIKVSVGAPGVLIAASTTVRLPPIESRCPSHFNSISQMLPVVSAFSKTIWFPSGDQAG